MGNVGPDTKHSSSPRTSGQTLPSSSSYRQMRASYGRVSLSPINPSLATKRALGALAGGEES